MIHGQTNPKVDALIAAWKPFLASFTNWQAQVSEIPAKQNGCGTVYELPNYLKRDNESVALVDMRTIAFVEPHYHAFGMWEIQFVLAGSADVFVGREKYHVREGDFIVIAPEDAYYAFPDTSNVLICLNTPPFQPNSYIELLEDNHDHHFTLAQFEKERDKHQK